MNCIVILLVHSGVFLYRHACCKVLLILLNSRASLDTWVVFTITIMQNIFWLTRLCTYSWNLEQIVISSLEQLSGRGNSNSKVNELTHCVKSLTELKNRSLLFLKSFCHSLVDSQNWNYEFYRWYCRPASIYPTTETSVGNLIKDWPRPWI